MGSKQIPAYPFDQRTPYMAFAHSSTDVQNFLLWAQENSPCVRAKSLVHSHCLCKALMHHTMASIDQLPSTNSQPELSVLQIPNQWWIPKVARTPELQDTSLAYIIWKQLEADSATILLPKYLLVVYQMSM